MYVDHGGRLASADVRQESEACNTDETQTRVELYKEKEEWWKVNKREDAV